MKAVKHSARYEQMYKACKLMRKSIYDNVQFNLYEKECSLIKKTAAFSELCKMIENERAVIMTARHFPKFEYSGTRFFPKSQKQFGTDYRLADSYEKAGFTVYRMKSNDYTFFSELYFDYMGISAEVANDVL